MAPTQNIFNPALFLSEMVCTVLFATGYIATMADPISLASGVLTLVVVAHKSCLKLYTTIQSFQTHPKRVRDLVGELEALIGVLQSLDNTLRSHTDVDLSALSLPLQRCNSACDEFLQELNNCCKRSGADRKSFRDWAKLRYMGDDIDDFKDSIAASKSTINIALTDVQIRKSSVTLDRLGDYNDLIKTTTSDLEARLENIDEKLQSLVQRTAPSSAMAELRSLEDERSSTQKGLSICAQFSELISQIQSSSANSPSQGSDNIPEKITSDGVRDCKVTMERTTAKLESHMQNILDRIDQIMSGASATMTPEETRELAGLRQEWQSARRSRDFCLQADQRLQENISVIDNHATGDETVQFLVSNSEKTIHGKNRGYGDQIKQLGGHVSDQSIQKVSGDFLQMSVQRFGHKASSSSGDVAFERKNMDELRKDWNGHGGGRSLKMESTVN